MHRCLRFLGGLLALLATSSVTQAQEDNRISQALLREDLETLKQILVDSHYAPYAVTDKATLEAHFQSLTEQVPEAGMDRLSAYRLLQKMTSVLGNGHTTVDFPVAEYFNYANAGGTVFPLEISFEDGAAFVRADFSGNDVSLIGREVLTLNGQPVDVVLEAIYPLVSAERTYYADARIELLSLPRYYWYAFGESQQFTVALKSENGEVEQMELPAIPVIDGYEMVRDEIWGGGRKLTFLEGLEHTAYLTPGDFSGDEQEFQTFIDGAFAEIRERETQTLIIDLRNNSGGNDSFSDYMVAYIADRPFHWYSSFKVRTSEALKQHASENMVADSAFTKAILTQDDGERFEFAFPALEPRPAEKRYEGDVYVLVNRQSHSMAAVTAAQIQDYGWATIVGEETAEYPSLYASLFPVSLPHTGATIQISKGYIVRVSGEESHHGVLPDIVIKDHLLDDNDEILAGLTAMLMQSDAPLRAEQE